MRTIGLVPAALSAADQWADRLADHGSVLPSGPLPDGRGWPQSLAGGAVGIAILHIERARAGRGDWSTVHAWLSTAVAGEVSAAANSHLFFGAPAIAFVTHLAASSSGRYGRLLARVDEATITITKTRIAQAHARIDQGERPLMAEFDLIRGLSGLGAYHLSHHPDHPITREVLAYLVRLTEPLPNRAGFPPWWTPVGPNGERSPEYPEGHGNLGVSHGIGAALAVMSLALQRGLTVPGLAEAIARICAWTDQWRQGDAAGPWWPGFIAIEQVIAGEPVRRPRPSWCYGVAGSARAQQLAGLALGESGRVRTAETAMLAALRDLALHRRLPESGLCHGTAGLLLSAWRMATTTNNPSITEELPRLAASLITALDQSDPAPELLDGAAGAALALHTVGTGAAPAPHWDAVLALA